MRSEMRRCIVCGRPFEPKNVRNVICSRECKKRREADQKKEYRDNYRKWLELEKPKKEVTIERPIRKKKVEVNPGRSTICERAENCRYSGFTSTLGYYCEYAHITGEIRGGYADECNHFEKKKVRKKND